MEQPAPKMVWWFKESGIELVCYKAGQRRQFAITAPANTNAS